MNAASPIRVAFVITGLGVGGAEMMLYKTLKYGAIGTGSRVFALGEEGPMAERIRKLGIEVRCLGMKGGLSIPRGICELTRLLRAWRPHVVSTWMYHADLIGGLAARISGVPVVWGLRNSTLDSAASSLATRAVASICAVLSYLIPSRIISCSREALDVHIARGYKASIMDVIPNGFELDRFAPSANARYELRRELGIDSNAPLIGIVGRDHPQKNIAGFIRVARLVHSDKPDARFLIVGQGLSPENKRLAHEVHAAGLADSVKMLGPRDDIPKIMTSLDLLVSTSSGEAFPNVLGEAMACGTPCVATNVGDSHEIIADCGIVVSPDNVEEAARAVLSIVNLDSDKRHVLAERARNRVKSHFDIREVARRYDRLLAGVGGFRIAADGEYEFNERT